LLIEFNLPTVDVQHLNVLVRALCALNVLYLRSHPNAPLMKDSGVVYKTQPRGCERFKTVPAVLAAGSGDCDQLAPWLAAEIRVKTGVKAMPEVKQMGPSLWHVFVRMPDGKAIDVSARLGMRVPESLASVGREIIRKRQHHVSALGSPRIVRAREVYGAQW
jgi:hypothetical protein